MSYGLGVPFGMSKADAMKHFEDANLAYREALAVAAVYPKAASDTGAKGDIGILGDSFVNYWDTVSKYSDWGTVWGKYADKADEYKAKFDALKAKIADQARATREAESPDASVPEIPGFTPPGKSEDGFPWGVVVVVGLIGAGLWYMSSGDKSSGSVAGMPRRRDRRGRFV